LEQWIRTPPSPFRLRQQQTSIRIIVEAGRDSGDPAAAETVTAIISLCIADGLDLRDILGLPPDAEMACAEGW